MDRRVRAVFCGIAAMTTVGACTLTTDLDGYAGPAVPPSQDAGVPVGVDAGEGLDATEDAPLPSAADAYRALVLSDSPVAYWRLDDTGSVAKDEVGHHDGTYTGNVQHRAGVLGGGAASFDGGSTIRIGDAFGFTEQLPFTIEAWISPTTAGSGAAACMVAKDSPNDAGAIEDGWAMYLGNSNEVIGSRWSSSQQEYAQGPAAGADVFSHVAMTYDGSSVVVFLNGEIVADLVSKEAIHATSASLVIGASRDGTGCFFHGVLDEVAIYDRALTNDRIAAHSMAGR